MHFVFTVLVLKFCFDYFSGDAVEDQLLREGCVQDQEEQNRYYILLASSVLTVTITTAFSDFSPVSVGAKLAGQNGVQCPTD